MKFGMWHSDRKREFIRQKRERIVNSCGMRDRAFGVMHGTFTLCFSTLILPFELEPLYVKQCSIEEACTKPFLLLGRFGNVLQFKKSWRTYGCGHFGSRFPSAVIRYFRFPTLCVPPCTQRRFGYTLWLSVQPQQLSLCLLLRNQFLRPYRYMLLSHPFNSINWKQISLLFQILSQGSSQGSWARPLFYKLDPSTRNPRRCKTHSPEAVCPMQAPYYTFGIYDPLWRRHLGQRRWTWSLSWRLLSMVWTFIQEALLYRWQERFSSVGHRRWIWDDRMK